MPLTLNVGLSKKIGQPDYGSLGVTCNVQVELDSNLLHSDLGGFHEKVKRAYLACHQAVSDELARQQQTAPINGSSAGQPTPRTGAPAGGQRPTNGQPHQLRKATTSQLRAIEAIVARERVDLPALLQQRFATDQLTDLSINQASDLIDELKGRAAGHGGRA